MPHPTRVAPRGELLAVAAHGTLMGNRGRLHDAGGIIRQEVTSYRGWVCCLLSFKGRKRKLRAPNSYTELFFLDEATAMSAGHRPCGTCRRESLRRFCAAVASDSGSPNAVKPTEIDRRLHAERLPVGPGRAAHRMTLGTLPYGAFVETGAAGIGVCLWWNRALWPWRADGYGAPCPAVPSEMNVVTPGTMLAALRGGYVPEVHPSVAG